MYFGVEETDSRETRAIAGRSEFDTWSHYETTPFSIFTIEYTQCLKYKSYCIKKEIKISSDWELGAKPGSPAL